MKHACQSHLNSTNIDSFEQNIRLCHKKKNQKLQKIVMKLKQRICKKYVFQIILTAPTSNKEYKIIHLDINNIK